MRAVKITVGFAIIVCLCYLFDWLLVNDVNSYTRVTFHEFYKQGNIDILFLGSSHTYRSLDTDITDEIFGKNTFNAGTSSQDLDGTYTILIEACKYNDIQEVYLDLYYLIAQRSIKERTSLTSTYIISDYLNHSLNRTRYLLCASGSEHYVNSFFPARRNWKNLFDIQYLAEVNNRKGSENYKNYEYIIAENEYYSGKGYVANNSRISRYHNYSNSYFRDIDYDIIPPENIYYINKIIDFCKKNNIKLTFFVAPMPDFYIFNLQNYDNYIEDMNNLAEKNNIGYYDFNLCRQEYFSGDDCYFFDNEHMNRDGAEAFSKLFSDLFTGKIKEEDLFYSSYEEKVESIPYKLLGYFDCVEGGMIIQIHQDILLYPQ